MQNNFSIARLFSETLIYFYLLCLIVIITLFLGSYCTISSHEIGLVYEKNRFKKSLTTGIYFLLPKPLETIFKVPIHTQSLSIDQPIDLICADHQILRLNACMLTYRFNPLQIERLANLFQTQQTVYLLPLLHSLLIEETALRPLDEVMISNASFNQQVKQCLQEKCDQLNYPIVIENILSIATIPEELTEAFESKNRAKTQADHLKTRTEAFVEKINFENQNELARITKEAQIASQKNIQQAKELSEDFLQQLALYEKEPQAYVAQKKKQLLQKIRQQAVNSTVILDDDKTDIRLLIPRQMEVKK